MQLANFERRRSFQLIPYRKAGTDFQIAVVVKRDGLARRQRRIYAARGLQMSEVVFEDVLDILRIDIRAKIGIADGAACIQSRAGRQNRIDRGCCRAHVRICADQQAQDQIVGIGLKEISEAVLRKNCNIRVAALGPECRESCLRFCLNSQLNAVSRSEYKRLIASSTEIHA